MERQVILTDRAPAAIGPYSQAIRLGDLIFVSGQIPIDPATGKVVEGDIALQTAQVLKNVAAILESAGSGLAKVLKTTVYLRDISDFARMNEVYAAFFKQNPPTRATVEVSRLPREVAIEIDAISQA